MSENSTTEIISIVAQEVSGDIYFINGEKFYPELRIMTKRQDRYIFAKISDLVIGDKVFDYDNMLWTEVEQIDIINDQSYIIYNIETDSSDIIFMQNSIIYNK